MNYESRKAALAAYKERKVFAGIYAVRCLATGRRWLGRAGDLATVQNRLWFTLRLGTSRHRTLQQSWNQHGEQGFAFEEVERLDDEALRLLPDRVLDARLAHWRDAFGAETL